MSDLAFDIRYAARRLRQSPGFSAVVILTLALGIGANSAIFSVVNSVLLKPLPYREPSQLATINHFYPQLKLQASVSAMGFKDYRDRTHSFSGVAAQTGWNVNITGVGEPERLNGVQVSGRWFSVLGINPARGRALIEDDDQQGHNHVVVLNDGIWRRIFGADPAIVGKQISLNGEAYQVVGIMPPGFIDPWNNLAEIWTPIALPAAVFTPTRYTNEFLQLTMRLKPNVTVEQAQREMTAFAEQLKKDYPGNFSPDWTLQVRSMNTVLTGGIRPALLVLLGAVGFVLLIACANVANLMLARAASRQREVAVRTALGARPWDLVRQLLAESVMLSLLGGALGLLIAYLGVRGLVAMNPGNVPRIKDLAVDGRVALFTLGIAALTGVIFGLVPAMQARRGNLHATLKEGSRSGTADRGGQLLRRVLVVSEIALALTLLTGGGLLLKSFARLSAVDPGFTPAGVLTFTVSLPNSKYTTDQSKIQLWDRLFPRLQQVPGVIAAGGTSVMPFTANWSTTSFNVEGYTPPARANSPWGDIRIVSPGFHATMKIPLKKGRLLDERDNAGSVPVAVVDEEFVRRFYRNGEDPIGKRFWFGSSTPDSSTRYISIVGVVGHAAHEGLDAEPRVQYYLPLAQTGPFGAVGRMDVAVRSAGDPALLTGSIRSAIHEIDPDLPLAGISTLDDLVARSLGQRRLSTLLLSLFAGLALLLASLGIYGVMSYTVAQRTRELGVRVALGASRERVLALVLKQGVVLTVIGAVLGLIGGGALTRLISSQLFGVKATDFTTFALVTLLLLAVASAATLLPALRATRVDPMVALREE